MLAEVYGLKTNAAKISTESLAPDTHNRHCCEIECVGELVRLRAFISLQRSEFHEIPFAHRGFHFRICRRRALYRIDKEIRPVGDGEVFKYQESSAGCFDNSCRSGNGVGRISLNK